MLNLIKKLYHYYTPNRLKMRYRRECLGRGINWNNLQADNGAEEELDFIKKNRMLLPIPYEWTMKYHAGNYKVHKDKNGFFCLVENKKIYFPDEYAIDGTASEMVNALMMEQDIRSPHQYFQKM